MTRKIISLLIISCGLFISCEKSNNAILNKSISKLNSIKTIEYMEIMHVIKNEAGIDEIDTVLCYFDFTSEDSLIRAKYHFVHNKGEQVFDGKKMFFSDNNEERVLYNNEPSKRQLCGSVFMRNSIYALKKLLPEFIDKPYIVINRQNDTIINGEENFIFNISLKDRYINFDVRLLEQKGFTENYELIISKKSYLPTQFTNIYSENKGYNKASFSSFNLSPSRPDSIWEYDRFAQRYLVMSTREFGESLRAKVSLTVGQKAPNWSLPLLEKDSIQLSDLKGSPVLLEFWFPYCGGCVLAIPKINTIQDIYAQKGLKVFGIEFSKSNNKGLDDYIRKQKIEYPTLHTGIDVAKEYGINADPTFFLIDKNGFIVYSSVGLNNDDLIKAIKENIK